MQQQEVESFTEYEEFDYVFQLNVAIRKRFKERATG
jgi:hypothetical protein